MAVYKTYIKALSTIQTMKQGFIISPTRTWFHTVKLRRVLYKFLKQTIQGVHYFLLYLNAILE